MRIRTFGRSPAGPGVAAAGTRWRRPARRQFAAHRLTAVTATVVLLGVALNAPASTTAAADPGELVQALTGTVLLPDAAAPAPAAAVDLLVGGVAVARDVTGSDGTFSVGLPADPALIAAAMAAGGRLPVQWRVSDLIPAGDPSVPTSMTPLLTQASEHTPVFSQAWGEAVAHLVDNATGIAYDVLHSDPGAYTGAADWQFRLPPLNPDSVVTKLTDTIAPLSIFNDPDYVLGNEDVNDPDTVPPLNVVREDVELPLDVPVDVTTPIENTSQTLLGGTSQELLGPNTDVGSQGACKKSGGYWYPRPGAKQPTAGVNQETYVGLFNCDSYDDDRDSDYWSIGFDGSVSVYDTADAEDLGLWRFKYRLELLPDKQEIAKGGYYWVNTAPEVDYTEEVPELSWTVGFEGKTPTGSIGGSFKPNFLKQGKFHQWRDDAHRTNGRGKKILWHGSWLAKNQLGVRGAIRGNGGGVSFRVPQGVAFQTIVAHTRRSMQTWRCWHAPYNDSNNSTEWRCDPR